MFLKHSLVFVVLLVCVVQGETSSDDEVVKEKSPEAPVVKTMEGDVKGMTIKSLSGRDIYGYLGMPYAKPPVGELRFSYPRRPDPWSGVHDGTKDGSKCAHLSYPERIFEGDENCLFVNVFTTKFPNETERSNVHLLHDVVVVIHDGGFTYNSGNYEDYMPDHLLDHDIVLVTFNFRIGVLGFMTTDDEWAVGNYGMKDQVEVLWWVKRNIENFGGNPQSVTLLGTHSGGSSAHLLMLTPMAKDLFHGAISLSGTALSPWAVLDSKVAKARTEKLAKVVGCSKRSMQNTKAIVKCLRNKYTLDLVSEAHKTVEWSTDMTYPFVPVVEHFIQGFEQFLPAHPMELMKTLSKGPQGRWEKPWLVGFASNEALPQALQAMIFPYIMNSLNTNPDKYIPLFLGMELSDELKGQGIGKQIWDFYLNNETLQYSNLNRLEEIATDYNVYHGLYHSVNIQSKSSLAPIFVYRFTFDHRTNLMTLGVPQGDDMELMFPNVLATKKREYRESEMPIIAKLTQIVANFAKYGDPTPEGSELLGSLGLWPQATDESFQFVDFGDDFKIEEGFYKERMDFWDQINKRLNEKPKHDEL